VEPFWSDLCGRDPPQASTASACVAAMALASGMFVRINGKTHYLWRAVDQEGEVLEACVTKNRNRKAALTFLRKVMKRYGRPKTIVTDKLGSYRAALRTIGNAACQETGRWLNNRAENSHQPLRRHERVMQRFRQMRTLQTFAAIHSSVHKSFQPGAPSLQLRKFQAEPRRRPHRVARAQCRIIVRRSSANVGAL
jgi:transposase-like protein